MLEESYKKIARILRHNGPVYGWTPLYGKDEVTSIDRIIRQGWMVYHDAKQRKDPEVKAFIDSWEYFVASEIRARKLSFEMPESKRPPRRSSHHAWITVYLVDRSCYSAAEGGCWYDHGDVVFTMKVSRKRLNQELRYWREWAREENANRRSDIGSVRSEGRYDVEVSEGPGRNWPGYVPVYE